MCGIGARHKRAPSRLLRRLAASICFFCAQRVPAPGVPLSSTQVAHERRSGTDWDVGRSEWSHSRRTAEVGLRALDRPMQRHGVGDRTFGVTDPDRAELVAFMAYAPRRYRAFMDYGLYAAAPHHQPQRQPGTFYRAVGLLTVEK